MKDNLVDLDKAWIHPLSNWADQEKNGPWLRASAKGMWVRGTDGTEMLDAFSGLWCVNVGYGHESIVEAASEQMRRLPFAPAYFGSGCEASVLLAAKLGERAPGDCRHVYFTPGGGSDAVDTAVKFVRYHNNVIGKPEKKHFIALDKGYHGVSTAGSGLTGLPVFQANFDAPSALQHHIPTPSAYRHANGDDGNAVIADTISAFRQKVDEIGVDKVAAFICEPVLGTGGVHVPPPGFFKAIREVCRELDILFIADEVITGFGRCGPLFACSIEDVDPDFVTVAKGLTAGYVPMGAVFVSDAVYRRIADATASGTPVGHGHTYSGHPVAAAVGLEVLRLYEEGGILANGQDVGPYFQRRLKELHELPLVGDVRGCGMLAGIELVADKDSKLRLPPDIKIAERILATAKRNNILFRAYPFPDSIIALAPALIATRDEVDILISRLTTVITEVAHDIQR